MEITQNNKKKKYVAYYRVSTQKQSLGIEAQKTMVSNYLNGNEPIKAFTEKESGKSDKNRPQLQLALALAKKEKAVLVVATLSRLSRDLHFITSLGKSKVDFVICDMPDASPLTIHIMGAIAQYERETISNRTKRALNEVKKQGKLLGYNNPKTQEGLEKLWSQKRKAKAVIIKKTKLKAKKGKNTKNPSKRELADQKIVNVLKTLRKRGLSWSAITKEVNDLGIETRQNGKWHLTSIRNVARRNGLIDAKDGKAA